MTDPKKKGGLALMIAMGKPPKAPKMLRHQEPDGDEPDGDEGEADEGKDSATAEERCGADLADAIKGGDGRKVIEALKAAMEYCD